jgi:hypothetical protein
VWAGCWSALLLLLAGCAPFIEDPACWAKGGGTLDVQGLVPGGEAALEVALPNRCDRPLDVIRVTLSGLSLCEGDCPAVTLSAVPTLPLRVAAGASLTVTVRASAARAGRTESLLAVTTGEPDAPENQVWTVVAEAAP